MAHFGNQLHSADSHGNPISHGTAGYGDHLTGGHGDHHFEHGTGDHTQGGHNDLASGLKAAGDHGGHWTDPNVAGTIGKHGTGEHQQNVLHGDGATGVLRRSGSSSSSSSEDDGLGGRRKKGIKEKVKEKLPGGHNKPVEETPHQLDGAVAPQEKKGIVEKVKEKLSGNH